MHDAGYIDQTNEIIVGLQTDAPLKRAIMPNGGLRMVEGGLQAFGFKMDPAVSEIWSKYRKGSQQWRLRRLFAGDHEGPQIGHPDRIA